MNFPKLYKTDQKGKIREWEIWTEGNWVVTRHGHQNGTQRTDYREIEHGTNIGRANFRDEDAQADFEAKAEWDKKIKFSGYVEDLTKEVREGLKPVGKGGIKVMKAQDYSDKGMQYIGFPCYAQPKLDGVRCIFKDGALWSSGGIQRVGFPTIEKYLNQVFDYNDIIDGELYLHGMPLNEINGIASNRKDDSKKHLLSFWIFDSPKIADLDEKEPYIQRATLLSNALKPFAAHSWLKMTPTYRVSNEEELLELYSKFVSAGFEGLIVRSIEMPYEQKRSKLMLKRKDFSDAEFAILYPVEGAGRDKGTAGSFTCKCSNGRTFNCRVKGTYEYRRQLLEDPSMWQGKHMTVRYLQMIDGVPQIPIGHNIRSEDDI